MDFKTVVIKLSDEINEIMEDRGIKEEDVREVLEYAESTGMKLYLDGENRYLAKKRINNFTANVEYSLGDNEVVILNIYSYIIRLVSSDPE